MATVRHGLPRSRGAVRVPAVEFALTSLYLAPIRGRGPLPYSSRQPLNDPAQETRFEDRKPTRIAAMSQAFPLMRNAMNALARPQQ